LKDECANPRIRIVSRVKSLAHEQRRCAIEVSRACGCEPEKEPTRRERARIATRSTRTPRIEHAARFIDAIDERQRTDHEPDVLLRRVTRRVERALQDLFVTPGIERARDVSIANDVRGHDAII
jgi:hypothetical protein